MISIRPADPVADLEALLDLAIALFPDAEPREKEREEMRGWFARTDSATFVAFDSESPSTLLGYIDVGARSIADGCATSPVAYVEAWYVVPDRRREGIGEALIRAAETWGRSEGYSEIASDTQLENELSQRLHLKFGFEETGRVVQFKKTL